MASEYTVKVGEYIKCKDTYEAALLQTELARNGIESVQISEDGQMYLRITAVFGKNNNNCKKVM